MSENETKQPSAGEVLDYLERMEASGKYAELEPDEVSQLMNRLRALAAPQPTLDRSDRFASEMLHFESIKEAEQAHDAHRRAMRDERRTRFERRIREALERNWQAWPLATPHGVAGYLADALCPPTEAGEAT